MCERTIIWKCAKGRNSSEGVEYIRRNIDNWIRQYSSIWLYVQLGTCDFTTLTKDSHRYLNLDIVPEGEINHSAVSIRNFEKIAEIAQSKHVKVTLIEIPYFSIKRWNIRRRHPRPHIFERQDRNLSVIIRSVNEHIHRINRLNRIQSPLLNVDLETSRKNRGRGYVIIIITIYT